MIAISSNTAAKAVESPNSTAPKIREIINPRTLKKAPSSFPKTEITKPTHLKNKIKINIANSIDNI